MITEPLPLVVVLSVVPKTASTYWSRDTRRLFVAFVPLTSPSHCRNVHPGAGTISREAQWFEDHSPIADAHKKKDVVGISAKVIAVLGEVGDSAPVTPVGINLPNADWIREKYGSKSVMAGNIMAAYNYVKARSPATEEFAATPEVAARIKKHGALASDLHVDMHEVIGHASGKINPGVATPDKTLKSYAGTLEAQLQRPCNYADIKVLGTRRDREIARRIVRAISAVQTPSGH